MSGSILLVDVANRTDTLDVGCNRCNRRGRLSTARLLGEHGPEMPMPDLLRLISADCPKTAAPQFIRSVRRPLPRAGGAVRCEPGVPVSAGGGADDQLHLISGEPVGHDDRALLRQPRASSGPSKRRRPSSRSGYRLHAVGSR